MNDFTIVSCQRCGDEMVYAATAGCRECDRTICWTNNHSCSFDCPICDWTICFGCVKIHKINCWDQSDEIIKDGNSYCFYKLSDDYYVGNIAKIYEQPDGSIARIDITGK